MTQSIVAMCHDAHALTTYIYTHIHPHTRDDASALTSRYQLVFDSKNGILYVYMYKFIYICIHKYICVHIL